MSISKIVSRFFSISVAFLIVASLFFVDFSVVLPIFKTYTADLYAQNTEQGVKMYLSSTPASGTVGTEFSILVKLDSTQLGINAVQSDITYPAALLQLTGIDTASSAFPLEVTNSGANGIISIVRGSFTPVSGSGLIIAKLNFKSLNTGNALIQFKDSSAAVNSQIDSLTQSPNLTIIIKSPSPSAVITPTPSPVPTPTPIVIPSVNPSSSPVPSVTGSTIKIFAAGTSVLGIYPEMKLEIKSEGQKNWNTVKTFTNVKGDTYKRAFQEFTYTQNSKLIGSNIRVRFTNDWYNSWIGDRNLMVDKISVNGIDIQTERNSTYSTGTWTSNNGCGAGYKKSEWLQCNGYFEFR